MSTKIEVIKLPEREYIVAVSNSDFNNTKAAFSKQTLESIFDFDRYHSSKRNQFKITKGALGDALKELLCIPHVLARDYGIVTAEGESWNYPMYIISQQKLYKIQLIIDRINQVIHSKIEESDFDSNKKTTTAEIEIQRHSPTNHNSTQIVLTIPIIINGNDYHAELIQYVYDYAMFATHVTLTFEDKDSPFFKEFPQLQKINPKWKNQTSIYYYDKKRFSEFILGLDNNNDDSIVYDVLYNTFREGSNMQVSN
jgi:hypothetical protein